MSLHDEARQKFLSLVTLSIQGELNTEMLDKIGLHNEELPAMIGYAAAECGNLIGLLAAEWKVSDPLDVWRAIRAHSERARLA